MPLHPEKPLAIKPLKRLPANEPAPLTPSVVSALQALERGEASADQQQKALEFIINEMSRPYDPANWQPGQHEMNDFAAGRSFVGQQIIGALKLNLAYFINKENSHAK